LREEVGESKEEVWGSREEVNGVLEKRSGGQGNKVWESWKRFRSLESGLGI
jgi:hypothetical protein